MASTYSTMKAALDEITDRIQTNRKRLISAQSGIAVADGDLAAMTSNYTAILADINAFATANPSDTAALNLKAEKNFLVSEFQALKTTSSSMKTDVDAYTV